MASLNKKSVQDVFVMFVTIFNNAFKDYKPQWSSVATEVPSNTSSNLYPWLGAFPKFRKWIGERHVNKFKNYRYSIDNEKFESTIEIDRDDVEDDNLGIYKPLVEQARKGSLEHPDELVFLALNQGHENKCYDGQYFFDHDHPNGDEGTFSNMTDGAGPAWYLLDSSNAIKAIIYQVRKKYQLEQVNKANDSYVFLNGKWLLGVDARANAGYSFPHLAHRSKAELNQENFKAVREAMEKMTDESGRKLGIKVTQLVCGPSNRSAAEALILRDKVNGGDTNELYKSVELVVSPYLD
jgi:phage major head subunit gpT-like protein